MTWSSRACVVLALAALVLSADACGGAESADPLAVREDGPDHVHGLGHNPRDGALVVATHSGLFRLGAGDRELRRIGDLRQDTMGFAVVGADRFLGSGHPDARTNDPPHLGLVASEDGGRSWRSVSLRGKADFHALAAHSHVIYGYDGLSGRLLVSASRGRSWSTRTAPGPFLSLVLDPAVETRLAGATDEAVFISSDAGATWNRSRGIGPGLLAWPRTRELLHVAADGVVSASDDRGRTWEWRGDVGAQPAALSATGDRAHLADAAGRILGSDDGGRTWSILVEPRS